MSGGRDPPQPNRRRWVRRAALAGVAAVRLLSRLARTLVRIVGWTVSIALTVALVLVVGNLFEQSPRDVPARALDPAAGICRTDETQWSILAKPVGEGDKPGPSNDELWTVAHSGPEWRQRFACAIQHHALPNYHAHDGTVRSIGYDLAFVEFHEDGKPYALRRPCQEPSSECVDEGYGLVEKEPERGQLEAVLAHLRDSIQRGERQYVVVWVHGWRHDARTGDANVTEFRSYAAQVARFLEDRVGADPSSGRPSVTAIYMGWRGARTDENWLRHQRGIVGQWVGDVLAWPTLFDRKPVSEAIGPAVVATLRAVERTLGLEQPIDPRTGLPPKQANHMIVFAHSLGANMLATALEPDLVKKVERHPAGSYMLPVLGDLVVLINPASEATKWTEIQRAVWTRMAILNSERVTADDYVASHTFFPTKQRPILISLTAALDWPPGGYREIDCGVSALDRGKLISPDVEYDWATHDLFPAFKGDFRPLADRLERTGTHSDPHNACRSIDRTWWRMPQQWVLLAAANLLRVVPFMQTDPEQTETIGQLDPPRTPLYNDRISGRPVGTTHELWGLEADQNVERAHPRPEDAKDGDTKKEITLDYDAITGPDASCPVANGWLDRARRAKLIQEHQHAIGWSSADAQIAPGAPSLRFDHGYRTVRMPPITRANDPFWNMRAYDTALARHDGYMLTSFICAMNQLVMDQPTIFDPMAAARALDPKPESVGTVVESHPSP